MNCYRCGKDQDCTYIRIVTGKALDYKTSYSGENRVAKITYGEFEPYYYYICQDCWRQYIRKEDKGLVKLFLIFLGFGILLMILGFVIKEGAGGCKAIGYFTGGIGLIGAIITGIIFSRKDYAALDVTGIDNKELFKVFNEDIAKHVYKSKGAAPFWEQGNWQDWMDKKPNITVDTRVSKP